jgi:phage terminase Nu1 subunit (DNA packaging protein)
MASAAQCAKHIDLKERRFRDLVDEGVFKRATRGNYNLDEIRTIYIRRLRAEAAGRADSATGLTEERTRLTRATANTAERRDRAEAGKLVDIDAVAAVWDMERAVVRERLLTMGGELQGPVDMIPGVDAAIIIDGKAREILLEFSDAGAIIRRAARAAIGLNVGREAVSRKRNDDD